MKLAPAPRAAQPAQGLPDYLRTRTAKETLYFVRAYYDRFGRMPLLEGIVSREMGQAEFDRLLEGLFRMFDPGGRRANGNRPDRRIFEMLAIETSHFFPLFDFDAVVAGRIRERFLENGAQFTRDDSGTMERWPRLKPLVGTARP